MLSPGRWHEQVPKDRLANLLFRQAILQLCLENPAYRRACEQACREDILFFIDVFCLQFNPKKKGLAAVGPFITWDFQEEALLARPDTHQKRGILWCYENDRSAVIEKSREMGATWLFLIFQVWLCVFHPYVQTLNVSRSADAVDCKSPDSLFWKVRFLLRHLPSWLTGSLVDQNLFFHFPRTDSVITGEASTGRAGVGGRAGVIFFDEFSKMREATEARQRTANTADCRFFNSTHEGEGTEFFQLTRTPEFIKIVFHWTQHPEKRRGLYRYNAATNQIEVLDHGYAYPPDFAFVYSEAPLGGPYPGLRSPWYDAKCAEIGSARGVAIELDIDPGGSVSQFFNVLTIRHLTEQLCCPPYWEGDLSYDRETGKPLGLIPLVGGPLKLWIRPRADGTMPAGKYGAGADLATGNGATNSCLAITNAETGESVLEYATPHKEPPDMAPICTALCWLFKDTHGEPALLAWEHAGPGLIFGQRVVDMGYPRIYYRQGAQSMGMLRRGTSGKMTRIVGWYPSNDAKRLLLEEYRSALDGGKLTPHSADEMGECLPWHYDGSGNIVHPTEQGGNDPTGARVNHGDRVIARALSWMTCQTFGMVDRNTEEPETVAPGSLAWRRQLRAQAESEESW